VDIAQVVHVLLHGSCSLLLVVMHLGNHVHVRCVHPFVTSCLLNIGLLPLSDLNLALIRV